MRKTPVKAGIYFSHYECFGHTSRVIAVSQIFKKRFPQGTVFFIQAGIQQHMAKLDGRTYPLPFPFVNRSNFKAPICDAGAHTTTRSHACVDIMTSERPDVFFTEFFPLGREESRHELIPALVK